MQLYLCTIVWLFVLTHSNYVILAHSEENNVHLWT